MELTNTKAKEIIEEYAQEYLNRYGTESQLHDTAQKTPTIQLINKTLKYASPNQLAVIIALLLDANEYRTMDIMGICRVLINNENIFKVTYDGTNL